MNGNQVVSITASTTGVFEDTTHTDTVVSGDLLTAQIGAGATGTSISIFEISFLFDATTNTAGRYVVAGDNWITTSAVSSFLSIAGGGTAAVGARESVAGGRQYTAASSFNLSNLQINSNQHGSCAVTVSLNKNGSTATNTISIPSGSTGLFEDTTHTDSIVAGDLICYTIDTSAVAAQGFTYIFISIHAATSDSTLPILSCGSDPESANTTIFYSVGGDTIIGTATESRTQSKIGNIFTMNKLFCRIQANTVTAASTVVFRKGGVDTVVTLSVPLSATGVFEDTTNRVNVVASDLVSFKIAIGATGTTITTSVLGIIASIPTSTTVRETVIMFS